MAGTYKITDSNNTIISDISGWMEDHVNGMIEMDADQTAFGLATPDDQLIVVGPPRLSQVSDSLYPVGLVQNIQYAETAQLQPMKPIGSKRHLFPRTNAPIQGSIARLLFMGTNLYKALYQAIDTSAVEASSPQYSPDGSSDNAWYSNLEDDLFNIPFGLGIVYRAPNNGVGNSGGAVGGEYIEGCRIQSRNASTQSGQAMIMEQVTFMADRILGWAAYTPGESNNVTA